MQMDGNKVIATGIGGVAGVATGAAVGMSTAASRPGWRPAPTQSPSAHAKVFTSSSCAASGTSDPRKIPRRLVQLGVGVNAAPTAAGQQLVRAWGNCWPAPPLRCAGRYRPGAGIDRGAARALSWWSR